MIFCICLESGIKSTLTGEIDLNFTNGHEADLDFAKEFAHNKIWVENAQPRGVLIFTSFI